ncbi:hypothetical protein SAMN05216285_2238 [Natrinema salifodinae]|uniref:C2H2-type domain-containing protein n=1 Tax=Natrinema salifodinae TaxID=1202768 RepID=A0A1I0P7H1_9EURY|nr:hypothetical protein SAMN05216285_2238 [Natrinema salifodinae]
MSHQCPECGDTFESEKGRNLHHYHKHGSSLVTDTIVCANCGDEFEYYSGNSNGVFCSRSCLQEDDIGRCETSCDYCGDQFEYYPSSEPGNYCSASCKAKDKTGKDAPNWGGGAVKKTCVICSNQFSAKRSVSDRRKTCSKSCLGILNSDQLSGKNHPRWKGGSVGIAYGRTWTTVRGEVKGDVCQMPGCEKTETESGRALHVHHQIPVRYFDNPDDAHFEKNLITLCAEHHVGEAGLENRDSKPIRPPLKQEVNAQ